MLASWIKVRYFILAVFRTKCKVRPICVQHRFIYIFLISFHPRIIKNLYPDSAQTIMKKKIT